MRKCSRTLVRLCNIDTRTASNNAREKYWKIKSTASRKHRIKCAKKKTNNTRLYIYTSNSLMGMAGGKEGAQIIKHHILQRLHTMIKLHKVSDKLRIRLRQKIGGRCFPPAATLTLLGRNSFIYWTRNCPLYNYLSTTSSLLKVRSSRGLIQQCGSVFHQTIRGTNSVSAPFLLPSFLTDFRWVAAHFCLEQKFFQDWFKHIHPVHWSIGQFK